MEYPKSSLEGYKILELSSQIRSSYAGMLLADMGAEVIKVECCQANSVRSSPGFLVWNRGKKSLVIDFETKEGREIVFSLVKKVDVVITDLLHKEAKEFGLDYDSLFRLNSKLIYLAMPPFGESGPLCDVKADDGIVSAFAGLQSYQGGPDEPPVYIIQPLSSYSAALLGAIGVGIALYVRESSGNGQKVEVPLLNGCLSLMASNLVFGERLVPKIGRGNIQQGTYPTYRLFKCKDDWILLGAFTSTQWNKLCIALGREELVSDPRFDNAPFIFEQENIIALATTLQEEFRQKLAFQWVKILEDNDVPCALVNRPEDFMDDPQVIQNQLIIELQDPTVGLMKQMGLLMKLETTPGEIGVPAHLRGQDNRAILEWLDYSLEEIAQLRKRGIILM